MSLGGFGVARGSSTGQGSGHWGLLRCAVFAAGGGFTNAKEREEGKHGQFPADQVLDFLFLEMDSLAAVASVGRSLGCFLSRCEAGGDLDVAETVEGLEVGRCGFRGGEVAD